MKEPISEVQLSGKRVNYLASKTDMVLFSRGIAFVPFPTSGSHELVGSFIYIY